jgi:hypothetical protein
MRGLDPRIHRKIRVDQKMDCRFKSGNDEGVVVEPPLNRNVRPAEI